MTSMVMDVRELTFDEVEYVSGAAASKEVIEMHNEAMKDVLGGGVGGAIGGALAGSVGGPAGALAGGVVGFLGGMFAGAAVFVTSRFYKHS